MLRVDFDMSALDAQLGALQATVADAIRPAAQAGAQVLYDEVRSNVDRIGKVTGNLQSAVYQAYAKREATSNKAVYDVSVNLRKAPHALLVEHGHIQRYASYVGKDGKWHTAVKASMRGKPRPKRRASQSVKDAYYVPLAGGPKQVAAKPFIRPAKSKISQALEAVEAEFFKRMGVKNEP